MTCEKSTTAFPIFLNPKEHRIPIAVWIEPRDVSLRNVEVWKNQRHQKEAVQRRSGSAKPYKETIIFLLLFLRITMILNRRLQEFEVHKQL